MICLKGEEWTQFVSQMSPEEPLCIALCLSSFGVSVNPPHTLPRPHHSHIFFKALTPRAFQFQINDFLSWSIQAEEEDLPVKKNPPESYTNVNLFTFSIAINLNQFQTRLSLLECFSSLWQCTFFSPNQWDWTVYFRFSRFCLSAGIEDSRIINKWMKQM